MEVELLGLLAMVELLVDLEVFDSLFCGLVYKNAACGGESFAFRLLLLFVLVDICRNCKPSWKKFLKSWALKFYGSWTAIKDFFNQEERDRLSQTDDKHNELTHAVLSESLFWSQEIETNFPVVFLSCEKIVSLFSNMMNDTLNSITHSSHFRSKVVLI